MSDTNLFASELEPRLRRACADLRARLRARLPCRVETILDSEADLGSNEEAILELVYTEWATRDELGERPDRQEMYRRFPALTERLERLFQVHDGVVDPQATPEQQERTTSSDGDASTDSLLESARFEILEELGRGGMGIVFKARQVGLDRWVALKRILAGEFADEQARGRFRIEAEAAARLQHPNVVQIYEVGEDDGHPYLAMEYVAGVSLADRLRQGPLSPRAAAELIEILARAVQHAHERGVIHRDLKPGNILLAADGTPKITDFGLARQLDDMDRLTTTHAVLGTPSYMAPEQTTAGNPVAPVLDVYALGAILYETVTGRPPFLASSPVETVLHVRYTEPASLRQLQPACPRDLETICLKCLQKETGRRYPCAGALADDLRRFLDGKPIEARPTSTAERVVKWAHRRPAVAALTAVLALGAVFSLATISLLWLRAENALTDREAALRDLRAEKKNLERNQYRLQLGAAREAWTADNLEMARQILDECDPELRDAEWHAQYRASHALRHVWRGFKGSVNSIAFGADNRTVAAMRAGEGWTWDVDAPEEPPRPFPNVPSYFSVAAAPDGRLALMSHPTPDRFDVNFWTAEEKPDRSTQRFTNLSSVGVTRLSPDARRLALVRFQKKEIEVLDLTGGPTRTLALTQKYIGPPLPLAFSSNGRWLSAITNSGIVTWDLESDREPLFWDKRRPVSSMTIAPNGMAAIIAHPPHPALTEILLVDLPTGTLRHTLVQAGVQHVNLSHDGRKLAAGSVDKPMQIWDVETGKLDLVLRGAPQGAGASVFSPDGRWLATAGPDGAVRVWRVGED